MTITLTNNATGASFICLSYSVNGNHIILDNNRMAIDGPLSAYTVNGGVYPTLTPIQFYLAFTPHERIAIKSSTDPDVKEFWATYELAAQVGSSIDPNLVSIVEGLAYLATPATATPPGPGVLATAARIAQIQMGIAQ